MSLAQLASGSRITKAADDAAGLALSKNMQMHIRSASQATRNSNDAISLIQIAEGSFNEMNTMMVRLRELGVAASSDTIGDLERNMINREVMQLKSEMDRITHTTQWTSNKLLDGAGESFDFQVGIFSDVQNNQIKVNLKDIDTRTTTLGVDGVDFSTKAQAQNALGVLDEAINRLGDRRATLGAVQNRMTSTLDNLGVTSENLAASNSRLQDADIATTTTAVVKGQIMAQAGLATLAQANQSQAVALKLL